MKLTIQSDGGVTGTTLLNEAGVNVSDTVQSVQFSHKGGEAPQVRVELFSFKGTMSGEAAFMVADPRTGEMREVLGIVFADGESLCLTPGDSGS